MESPHLVQIGSFRAIAAPFKQSNKVPAAVLATEHLFE
jgi:hypothetical protein